MKTKRKSIWDNDYSPYGTYKGPKGNPKQWKDAFDFVMNGTQAAEIIQNDSPWSILGLKIGATIEDIKNAFRRLALINHPDKGGNSNIFMKIRAAYVILTNNH